NDNKGSIESSRLSTMTSEYSSLDDTTYDTVLVTGQKIKNKTEENFEVEIITTKNSQLPPSRSEDECNHNNPNHDLNHCHDRDQNNSHNNTTNVRAVNNNGTKPNVWEKICELNERQKCFVQQTSEIDTLSKNLPRSADGYDHNGIEGNSKSMMIRNEYNEHIYLSLPQPSHNHCHDNNKKAVENHDKRKSDHRNPYSGRQQRQLSQKPKMTTIPSTFTPNNNTERSSIHTEFVTSTTPNSKKKDKEGNKRSKKKFSLFKSSKSKKNDDYKDMSKIFAPSRRMIAEKELEQKRCLQKKRCDDDKMEETTNVPYVGREQRQQPPKMTTIPSTCATNDNDNTARNSIHTNNDSNDNDNDNNMPNILAHTRRMIAEEELEWKQLEDVATGKSSEREVMPPKVYTIPSPSALTRRRSRSPSPSRLRSKSDHNNNSNNNTTKAVAVTDDTYSDLMGLEMHKQLNQVKDFVKLDIKNIPSFECGPTNRSKTKISNAPSSFVVPESTPSGSRRTYPVAVTDDTYMKNREVLMGLEMHKQLSQVKDFVKLDIKNVPSFECGPTNRSKTKSSNAPSSFVVSESTPSGSRTSISSAGLGGSLFLPSAMSCFFPSNTTNALEGIEKDFFNTSFADNNQVMMDNNIADAASSKHIPNSGIEQKNSIIEDSLSSGTVPNAHTCSTGICHGIVSAMLLDVNDNDPLWTYINDNNNVSTQITSKSNISHKGHHTALPKSKVQKSSIREAANTYTAYEDESTYHDVDRYPMLAAKINKAKASPMSIQKPATINENYQEERTSHDFDRYGHSRSPTMLAASKNGTRYESVTRYPRYQASNHEKEQQQTRKELLDQMRYAVNKAGGGGSTENIDERYLMIMETQSSTANSESSDNKSKEIAPQWNEKDKYDFPSLHSA
ncbi:MAG: hypothetical protein ACI90V_003419, partial [Bacillariaceae sp.]